MIGLNIIPRILQQGAKKARAGKSGDEMMDAKVGLRDVKMLPCCTAHFEGG